MFCPRYGRPVSQTANFCGGCGLPRAEIEKITQPVSQPEPKNEQAEINELNSTLSQLEGDLTGIHPVENYTTDADVNTNIVEAPVEDEIKLEFEDITAQRPEQPAQSGFQSDYSANAPVYPYYEQQKKEEPQQPQYSAPVNTQSEVKADQNLTTVDFIWMLLISGIPVVGLLYLIYQGFVQQENVNRRSWARATLIVSLFACVLAFVFSIGIMMTSFLYW